MRFPMLTRTYFFTAVGGGVPGKGAGTARVTMTGVGGTIIAHPFFTEMFLPAGEKTTGTAAGEVTSGIIALFRIAMPKKTGGAGKETGIGKKKITGA